MCQIIESELSLCFDATQNSMKNYSGIDLSFSFSFSLSVSIFYSIHLIRLLGMIERVTLLRMVDAWCSGGQFCLWISLISFLQWHFLQKYFLLYILTQSQFGTPNIQCLSYLIFMDLKWSSNWDESRRYL